MGHCFDVVKNHLSISVSKYESSTMATPCHAKEMLTLQVVQCCSPGWKHRHEQNPPNTSLMELYLTTCNIHRPIMKVKWTVKMSANETLSKRLRMFHPDQLPWICSHFSQMLLSTSVVRWRRVRDSLTLLLLNSNLLLLTTASHDILLVCPVILPL